MRDHTDNPPSRNRTGRTAIWIVVAVILLAAVGVGVYGLWFAPSSAEPASSPTTTTTPTRPTAHPTKTAMKTPTGDPETFARQIAQFLFDWDATTNTPTSITTRLLDQGDPTGQETPGLASDITLYLPSTDAWKTLRGYHTRQRLNIDTVSVPTSWPDVTASASPEQILPGTTAFTVTGTRHRDGDVDGRTESTDRPVAFTMFVTCQPSFDHCHLMRLGQPDNPLR